MKLKFSNPSTKESDSKTSRYGGIFIGTDILKFFFDYKIFFPIVIDLSKLRYFSHSPKIVRTHIWYMKFEESS